MKTLFIPLLLISLFFIVGCNGSSGENKNVVAEANIVAANLRLISLNNEDQFQQSFESNTVITLQAQVLDQNNNPISGRRVNFTADLGDLSVTSKLTNNQGIAQATIANSSANLSAGTASATIGDLSTSIDYEYISSSVASIGIPNLTAEIRINGALANRFNSNEIALVGVTLLDQNGDPYKNQIINVTADVGELAASSILTTNDGTASVSITSNEQLGAGVITLSLADNSNVSKHLNYEIIATDTVIQDNVRLGYFDADNTFIEGKIKLSLEENTLSAGGTLGLSVILVDSSNKIINTPTAVSFTSSCVLSGNALIDETVSSIKGNASATFEDIKCAGVNGATDVVVASITTNGITHTASATINITGEQLGSIEFVSALPNSIVLKGSGGQETSMLTFVVKSALGNTVAQQEVDFSLDTTVGGISLGRVSGLTNSKGQVTTQVLSGTVPTTASVTAKATMSVNGELFSVQTQSRELSINTGLPEQTSITIAASVLNPEASTRGETSKIFVWLADSFNNPVPDGTPANFTTEGGTIESQCITTKGSCSVEWRATEPYLADHRATILVTTDGHETFYDTNGNNIFDSNDGEPILDAGVSSGFNRHSPVTSGFIDMSEAWRDDNANNIKDANETVFFDDNQDGLFSEPDGKFNGPQCEGSLCDSNAKISTIRKSLELVMSDGKNPIYQLTSNNTLYASNETSDVQIQPLANGDSQVFNFKFADSAMQTLPFNTTIAVSFSGGTLTGTDSYTVGSSASSGFRSFNFIIKNEIDGEPEVASLIITITTPNTGTKTYFSQIISIL